MCCMEFYFLSVKRKCKHRLDVKVLLALNKNLRYNTPISLYELRLYLEMPVTTANTKLTIYSQSDMLWTYYTLPFARVFLRLSESMLTHCQGRKRYNKKSFTLISVNLSVDLRF